MATTIQSNYAGKEAGGDYRCKLLKRQILSKGLVTGL